MTTEANAGGKNLLNIETPISGPKVIRHPNAHLAPHSYEEFSSRPFYVAIDSYTVSKAPVVRKVLDIASGTGAMIERLSEQGKLSPNFEIIAADIDGGALQSIKRNLQPIGGRLEVLQADATNLPVPDNWAQLVTLCNSVHLMKNPELVIAEAFRILADEGTLIMSTAYEKKKGYGDQQSRRMLGKMIMQAQRSAEEMGYKNIPHHPGDLRDLTGGNLVDMAIDAGFTDIQFETKQVRMDEGDIKAIFSYKDFVEGSLPGVPFDAAKDELIKTVEPTLASRNINSINRNWAIITAKKPL